MDADLRRRLIAVLEQLDVARCPTCGHPSGMRLEHYGSCDLAACLKELREDERRERTEFVAFAEWRKGGGFGGNHGAYLLRGETLAEALHGICPKTYRLKRVSVPEDMEPELERLKAGEFRAWFE